MRWLRYLPNSSGHWDGRGSGKWAREGWVGVGRQHPRQWALCWGGHAREPMFISVYLIQYLWSSAPFGSCGWQTPCGEVFSAPWEPHSDNSDGSWAGIKASAGAVS